MLALEVAFLTGRYVATAFDDRRKAEWPPHPARLFSALVAAHFETPGVSQDERAALEWMEGLGPPEICASEASAREVVTVFVPVNDASVVSSVEEERRAMDDAITELEVARTQDPKGLARVEKKVAKTRARFDDAVRRAIAAVPSGKEGKDGPARAASLLPEHRSKQPRTFPSVTPDDPRVVFAWRTSEVSSNQRAAIDALAARVVRLGHSSSVVTVRVCEKVIDPSWVPDETGEVRQVDDEIMLRVVEAGQLAALNDAFEHQADEPGRVMPASFQRYVRPRDPRENRAPTTIFDQEWIILRRVGGPRLPSVRAVDVARSVRSALLRAHGDDAPEILSGHRAPGEPTDRVHLAIVPLPFVGHDRADGSILGVALVLPHDVTRAERQAVYRALRSWQRAQGTGDESPTLPVLLGRAGRLLLAVMEEDAAQATLLPKTWCTRAKTWASATPVALDRNPGDLRSADAKRQSAAYAEAEETIAVACERIGLPRPKRVTAMPAAPLAGGDKVRQFPPYQTGKPPIQRVLVHARLTFESPVEGPIVLGAGRYLGLGLFRPLGDHG
ncbi:MAG: type I-U CRISPR-associated protein Csb2 [Polyangiaceae bacterium]